MKRKMQRLVASALFLAMIVGSLPANAIYAEATSEVVESVEQTTEVVESETSVLTGEAVETPAPTSEAVETLAPTSEATESSELVSEDTSYEVQLLAANPESFVIDFGTVDVSTTSTQDDLRYYWTYDTKGDNWRVNANTNSVHVGFGTSRIYPFNSPVSSTLYKTGKPLILDFTAPAAGYYDLSWDVVLGDKYGYADIYVNDTYVGTLDAYIEVGVKEQKLHGVYLNAGEYANTIKITPTGKSHENGHFYFGFSNAYFTATDSIATPAYMDAKADVSSVYAGRKIQIKADAVLSNGGLYKLEKTGHTLTYTSSNTNVATVTSAGLIQALSAGQTTITITDKTLGFTDTITFAVSPLSITTNITEGESFFVTDERTLETLAVLSDGTTTAANDLTISYASSNENVAKIEDGVLKVVGVGNAKITTTAKSSLTGETTTDVKNIVAKKFEFKEITTSLAKPVVQELDQDGVQLTIQAITPSGELIEDLAAAGFAVTNCKYTSLTPSILTIDSNGVCHYVSRGVAQVKVEATIDGTAYETTVDVVSSSAKTGGTLFTSEMIQNARNNATNTTWGAKELSTTITKADTYVENYAQIYDLIFAEGIPRSSNMSTQRAQYNVQRYCPGCGTNIYQLYGDEWEADMLNNPWKLTCPHCAMQFPTNDFALLYERGLDENGQYNRELAYANNAAAVAKGEKDALVNELYPEKGSTWMVDDGFGWSPNYGTYGTTDYVQFAPIAHYAHIFWYQGTSYDMNTILAKLREAYLWSGDEKYGIAGAILLDRIADVYPSFDLTKNSLAYHNSHGGGDSGKIIGSIWENFIAQEFVECYDAFYPMFEHEQVIAFLSGKAATLGLDNPKTNGNLIRENVENGIVRTAMQAVLDADVCGNFGFHQSVMTKAAVALDTQPETDEGLVWLTRPSVVTSETITDPIFGDRYSSRISNAGGEFVTTFVNKIDRDGFGAEVSTTYNKIWLQSAVEIADVLKTYGTKVLNLYDNPKFINMYDSLIYMVAGDGYSLALGDGGTTCGNGVSTFPTEVARGYSALRDPLLAQIYDYYIGGNYSGKLIDFYTDQDELVASIQADIAQYGKLKLESLNLTGYGLGMVRGGKEASENDDVESRYDTWMYYGRTEGSHAHLDMLQLGIDAYGFDYTPDHGYPEATGSSANRYEWVKASISHNLVLVNEEHQNPTYTGYPLHFDSTDIVKLMDIEAPQVYDDAEIYRRTAITIAASDDVSYTVDLFRVKGGDAHTYTFHTQGYKGWSTDDLNIVPQVDADGNYIGTYAGPDVPFGNDPNSTDTQYATNPMYPRGYTWMTDVNRGTDKTGDGVFTIDFKQTDFRKQVEDSGGLALKVHGVNDWVADSIDLNVGMVTRKEANINIPGLDYLLIQRRGEDLDTLFATVLEPYKYDSYIESAVPLTATVKTGTEGADDVSKVIKVTLNNGRTDYIIYATNKNVTYTVTDGNVSFDFAGFVGVYTVDETGKNIYSYVNDGTIIGNQTSVGAITGTIVDFTKDLVTNNYITIKPEQTVTDASMLNGQYIYVENDGAKCNGSYRIVSAETQGENIALYLDNTTLIESYKDDYNLGAGFVYTIAEGQSFSIPLSTVTVVEPMPDAVPIIPTEFTIDLCMGTRGALDNTTGKIGAVVAEKEGKGVTYTLTTSYGGKDWWINTDRTDIPRQSADNSLYVNAGTSSGNGVDGAHIMKWNSNAEDGYARKILYFNYGNTIGIDFEIPKAGIYDVQVVYYDREVVAANLVFNGDTNVEKVFKNAIVKDTNDQTMKTVELGEVTLVTGVNTLDLTSTSTTYKASNVRALQFTRLADVEEPEPVPEFTVTWADEDGTILETDTVKQGEVPTYDGTIPAKESTPKFSYTFAGWTPEVVAVTGDATYTATFKETINVYTVTWMNFDGSVLGTENYEYGATAVYKGVMPSFEDSNFTGWSPSIMTVRGDMTYTAQFDFTGVYWVEEDGVKVGYYYVDGKVKKGAGIVQIGDYLYYVLSTGKVAAGENKTIKAASTNGLIDPGTYYFLSNGVLETEEVRLEGEIRWRADEKDPNKMIGEYFVQDEIRKDVGLVEVYNEDAEEPCWYYVLYSGKIKRNYVADGKRVNHTVKTNKVNRYTGGAGTYSFYEDGVMYDPYATESGIVKYDANGKPYYYVDGHIRKDAGLIYVTRGDYAGEYIFVTYSGTLKKGTQTVKASKCNGHTEFVGTQKFDSNTGVMIIK